MTIKATLKRWWCGLTHGGGVITRDPVGRINWQCSKCGRWSDPIPWELVLLDAEIRKAREVKP